MKTYIKFLLKLFLISFSKVFFIFFSIILITNILEQADFFKETNFHFAYLIFLSFLNAPSIIFEILPFIFLISTQILFIKLIDNNELQIFKYTGLNNIKIIQITSLFTFVFGLFFVIFFYNISSTLQNSYLKIKNKFTNDDKYLAVVTENGLWIKDEIENKINIINASKVTDTFLVNVVITQFNENYDFIRTIHSPKVNISKNQWRVINPKILENNFIQNYNEINFLSNFDLKKINSLFSNLSSLSIAELIYLRKSYKSLNYSLVEIDSHLYRIISYPVYLTLISVLSAIIMFNIGFQKNSIFKIISGILLSVIIYYINYFFNILGTTERIPLLLSILLPLIILTIINLIFIVRLNEK